MRLSGVDPGIIRELSGIYKPFVKAFKELLSNSFDADAKGITVRVKDDLKAIEVLDDGNGMTPYDFRDNFARLGGSTAWLRDGKSPGGRPRIGYKGIGFLAVARYCSALRVETYSATPYRVSQTIARRNRKTVPLVELIGDVVPLHLLDGKVKIVDAQGTSGGKTRSLRVGKGCELTAEGIRLTSARALNSDRIAFDIEIDCRHLSLKAELNFDYLLGLERQADLRSLENFCNITVAPIHKDVSVSPHTRVSLHKLKDFVVRDLAAPAVKGKARNIVFKSGREQFLWRLARSAPVLDNLGTQKVPSAMQRIAEAQASADLPIITVQWREEEPAALARAVYLPVDAIKAADDTVVPIDIDEGGLRVIGYILARSEVVYPAELRGLSIRVRNVAIGDASFLGWEGILSGPRKAALSQITGELLVLEGLDAADAINPGRESFYEENPHYRILRRALFGSEESVGGLVGKAINMILGRIRIRSFVTDLLLEAKQRRRTLLDISSAVAFYSNSDEVVAKGLDSFFDTPLHANGLAGARDVSLRPGHKIAGFDIEDSKDVAGEVFIDYKARRVTMDFQRDLWSTSVYLAGHYYDLHLKQGKPEHPLCEIDNVKRCIYVNWGHPVKLHMDDASFLRSAILLRLSYHASPQDANRMMSLAMNMMAFRAE